MTWTGAKEVQRQKPRAPPCGMGTPGFGVYPQTVQEGVFRVTTCCQVLHGRGESEVDRLLWKGFRSNTPERNRARKRERERERESHTRVKSTTHTDKQSLNVGVSPVQV